jgi:transcriptional regulator with XRE-family HTH domain
MRRRPARDQERRTMRRDLTLIAPETFAGTGAPSHGVPPQYAVRRCYADGKQMSINEAASCLGARVRELRHERGLTLKALGRSAGLSHPFLSQLERGLARPSVGSVERIATALNVPVGALWSGPRLETAEIVRAGEKSQDGARELWSDPTGMRVREWSGGDRSWPDEAEATSGEVLLYVVRGSIEVELDGNTHVLEAGDAMKFDGAVQHRVRRRGPVTTRALYVAGG